MDSQRAEGHPSELRNESFLDIVRCALCGSRSQMTEIGVTLPGLPLPDLPVDQPVHIAVCGSCAQALARGVVLTLSQVQDLELRGEQARKGGMLKRFAEACHGAVRRLYRRVHAGARLGQGPRP